jgi:hypothetical protein
MRLIKAEYYDETGVHRHYDLRCCSIKRCSYHLITGPKSDSNVQLMCGISFLVTYILWIVFSGVFVAKANALLCIVPFVTLILVSLYIGSFTKLEFSDMFARRLLVRIVEFVYTHERHIAK